MDLIKIAEEAFATGKQHPSFKAGDTVTVAYRIVEGNKERIQMYRGVVIKICGHGEKKRFTVRKMSGTVGVERIFPLESPAIDSITVNKIGKVNCTTCANLPVRKPESRKNVQTYNSDSIVSLHKSRLLLSEAGFFMISVVHVATII